MDVFAGARMAVSQMREDGLSAGTAEDRKILDTFACRAASDLISCIREACLHQQITLVTRPAPPGIAAPVLTERVGRVCAGRIPFPGTAGRLSTCFFFFNFKGGEGTERIGGGGGGGYFDGERGMDR